MDAPPRVILHADMDAFFAAVEQLDHPELRGRPVIVGAAPNRRGVVAAASYEARAFGVRSAMPSRRAARLCPHGVFLPPRIERYEEMSRRVLAILERFTPLVEPLSIDEAVLDVTGAQRLFGDGVQIARQIKAAIREELGLTVTIGVAPNRFLAKLASELGKPDGLVVVPTGPEAVRAWLAPLPVGRLWGVGAATERRLRRHRITTIGDVAAMPLARLAEIVGPATARWLRELAEGRDERSVGEVGEEQSLSRERTFPYDVADRAVVEEVLLELVDDVGRRLRERGVYAGTARLKIRYAPFRTVTRQCAIRPPACDDFSLRAVARSLWRHERDAASVRLIGFGVARLCRERGGLELGFEEVEASRRRLERLSHVMDELNRRYGPGTVVVPRVGGDSRG
ncbi:MAG: DNA polymerase IV [Kiritimatiellae bacterium]|nr:DNA polymerase IV [Kiritimatiellia bacterium]